MAKPNISSVDLILLGLIRNQPMSAYDLSKMSGVFELVKISVPAIYKNVRRLEKGGHLVHLKDKKGNMPEKKIYSITAKGEEKFRELLFLCSSSAINFFFDFSVSLLFVNSIDRQSGEKIINSARTRLESKHEYLAGQVEKFNHMPFPIGNLGRQHLKISETLLEWLEDFGNDFQKLK